MTIFNGKIHYNGQFPIAMLNYQWIYPLKMVIFHSFYVYQRVSYHEWTYVLGKLDFQHQGAIPLAPHLRENGDWSLFLSP